MERYEIKKELVDLIGEKRCNMIGLTETQAKSQGKKILHRNYVLVYKGEEDGQYCVGFVVTPELEGRIIDIKCVSNRITGITLKH